MPDDLIDRLTDYARHHDLRGWEVLVREVFDRTVLLERIPAEGMIVELGTARAVNFQRLCTVFGARRCRGYDVTNVTDHPRVIEADVRALGPEHDGPIALGWNDLSDWEVSPASKRAGREFLLRNLVPGGLYVDAGFTPSAPAPAALPGVEAIAEDQGIVVWRRPEAPRSSDASPSDRAWWQWLDRMLQLDPWPCHLHRPSEGQWSEWRAGAAHLEGRLRWCGPASWFDDTRARELATRGRVLFAGEHVHGLHLTGRGQARACTLAPGDVLVVPPRWAIQRAAPFGAHLAWIDFEHRPRTDESHDALRYRDHDGDSRDELGPAAPHS